MHPLFNKHLDLSKQYFERLLKPGDIVIDATCGNGHDSLFLASLILNKDRGFLYTCDIQEEALTSAKNNFHGKIAPQLMQRIQFLHICHSQFPEEIKPQSVKLIVYNLGYLPGGDKNLTTKTDTTLKSITQALELITPGGAISITCYPGHQEGAIEEHAILELASHLNKNVWNCCFHRFVNRPKSPSLLLLQKAKN